MTLDKLRQYHYSLLRCCGKCGKRIKNKNVSGFCAVCLGYSTGLVRKEYLEDAACEDLSILLDEE